MLLTVMGVFPSFGYYKYLLLWRFLNHLLFLGRGPCCAACGIDLAPLPGMEPMAPALGARSLNHWTIGKSLWNPSFDEYTYALFVCFRSGTVASYDV